MSESTDDFYRYRGPDRAHAPSSRRHRRRPRLLGVDPKGEGVQGEARAPQAVVHGSRLQVVAPIPAAAHAPVAAHARTRAVVHDLSRAYVPVRCCSLPQR